eukprot:jgi/Mesvir1/14295/Mv09721-RA.1
MRQLSLFILAANMLIALSLARPVATATLASAQTGPHVARLAQSAHMAQSAQSAQSAHGGPQSTHSARSGPPPVETQLDAVRTFCRCAHLVTEYRLPPSSLFRHEAHATRHPMEKVVAAIVSKLAARRVQQMPSDVTMSNATMNGVPGDVLRSSTSISTKAAIADFCRTETAALAALEASPPSKLHPVPTLPACVSESNDASHGLLASKPDACKGVFRLNMRVSTTTLRVVGLTLCRLGWVFMGEPPPPGIATCDDMRSGCASTSASQGHASSACGQGDSSSTGSYGASQLGDDGGSGTTQGSWASRISNNNNNASGCNGASPGSDGSSRATYSPLRWTWNVQPKFYHPQRGDAVSGATFDIFNGLHSVHAALVDKGQLYDGLVTYAAVRSRQCLGGVSSMLFKTYLLYKEEDCAAFFRALEWEDLRMKKGAGLLEREGRGRDSITRESSGRDSPSVIDSQVLEKELAAGEATRVGAIGGGCTQQRGSSARDGDGEVTTDSTQVWSGPADSSGGAGPERAGVASCSNGPGQEGGMENEERAPEEEGQNGAAGRGRACGREQGQEEGEGEETWWLLKKTTNYFSVGHQIIIPSLHLPLAGHPIFHLSSSSSSLRDAAAETVHDPLIAEGRRRLEAYGARGELCGCGDDNDDAIAGTSHGLSTDDSTGTSSGPHNSYNNSNPSPEGGKGRGDKGDKGDRCPSRGPGGQPWVGREIATRYVRNPLLIAGRKFHIRTYAAIASGDPLVAFYHPAFVKVAPVPFTHDVASHASAGVHFTSGVGGADQILWSYDELDVYLSRVLQVAPPGYVADTLVPRFKSIMVLAFRMLAQTTDIRHAGYYQDFSFDFMLDDDLRLYVMEVNTDSIAIITSQEFFVSLATVVDSLWTTRQAGAWPGSCRDGAALPEGIDVGSLELIMNGAWDVGSLPGC